MNKNILLALLIIVLLLGGLWWLFASSESSNTPNGDGSDNDSPILDDQPDAAEIPNLIVVDRPLIGEQISSPLTIIGDARGYWFFEATAPVRLEDANGNVLVEHYVTAQGEWMTENFVRFEGTLNFAAPQTNTGTLILERSNPSDLEENSAELRISVRFR